MGTLHIMIGVSGSGKTTKTESLSGILCSADAFFTGPGLKYYFNPKELKWAHMFCQGRAAAIMKFGADVIIDNTNVVQEHIKPYLEMANHFKYDVVYHKIHEELTEEQLEEFAQRNQHGVPLEVIKRQYENFKEDWL